MCVTCCCCCFSFSLPPSLSFFLSRYRSFSRYLSLSDFFHCLSLSLCLCLCLSLSLSVSLSLSLCLSLSLFSFCLLFFPVCLSLPPPPPLLLLLLLLSLSLSLSLFTVVYLNYNYVLCKSVMIHLVRRVPVTRCTHMETRAKIHVCIRCVSIIGIKTRCLPGSMTRKDSENKSSEVFGHLVYGFKKSTASHLCISSTAL